jgi:O-methyltransferase domain
MVLGVRAHTRNQEQAIKSSASVCVRRAPGNDAPIAGSWIDIYWQAMAQPSSAVLPSDVLMDLSMGFTLSRAVQAVAELGIADALGEQPRTAEELAEDTGTHPGALTRALRLLSIHGVFEKRGETYVHNAASRLLRSDHPHSMRAFVRMQHIPALWRMWEHLTHSLKTGRSAAELTMPGGDFYTYFTLPQNAADSRIFNDAMTGKSRAQIGGILRAYDFSGLHTLADIAGGNGHLLQAILAATPGLRGILFDLPAVIAQRSAIASDRLELVAGDFFKGGLPACDAYCLMQILHNWSDEECDKILASIRQAALPGARLLVIEWLAPEEDSPDWVLLMDMIMLAELTGRERTRDEFLHLLARGGFRLDRVIDAGFRTHILEACAV